MVEHFCEPAQSTTHRHGFEIAESWRHWEVVLSVIGEVDIVTAPHLSRAICEALGKSATTLVIDLTEVTFLASVGMSVLVTAQQAADAMAVRFAVVAEGVTTRRPITLLGIDAVLALYPTLDDALRAVRRDDRP
ncbi:STAS domain-containing protein [Mycolicibacterium stellerae]|uniref:STAS domain-containing protein n=1 Tax=Mycolicibacterium stellerae TaxID=2358193 RepID=UPI000F0B5077|nr:STAS domain-containing protein [Mycolicibacterium stellerae]